MSVTSIFSSTKTVPRWDLLQVPQRIESRILRAEEVFEVTSATQRLRSSRISSSSSASLEAGSAIAAQEGRSMGSNKDICCCGSDEATRCCEDRCKRASRILWCSAWGSSRSASPSRSGQSVAGEPMAPSS